MPTGLYSRQKYRDPPRNRTGLKGVIYCPNLRVKPWKSYGRHHGMYVNLGYFATKGEAAAAYNEWVVKVYGPDAYLNTL